MRRPVVVLIAAVLLFALVGCGGGGAEDAGPASPAPETTGASTSTVPPVTQATDPNDLSSEASDTLSPLETQAFEPFPTAEEVLPASIKQRLDAGQPMLVLFGDTTQKTYDDQVSAIDPVMSDYRGLISFVSFDVGKFVTSNEDGAIEVKPGMEDDATASQVARLMGTDYLDVRFTPYLVYVNADGYITHRVRGYVDSALIEREVLRATE